MSSIQLKRTASQSSSTSSSTADTQASGSGDTLQAEHDASDLHAVEEELRRYEAAGTLTETELKGFDLIFYWDVRDSVAISQNFDHLTQISINQANRHTFPLLFRVALDVLPAQASAVPCERVFSSSKQTCTDRRSRLAPDTLETLQLLKFAYREDRLEFEDPDDFVTESDLFHLQQMDERLAHVSQLETRNLLMAGKVTELQNLFNVDSV